MGGNINNFDASTISKPDIPKPNAVDLLGGLYSQDPKLFWFLENKDPRNIQNFSEGYNGMTYGMVDDLPVVVDFVSGTLASDEQNKPNEDAYMNIDLGRGRTLFGLIDGASSQAPISGLAKYGVSGAFYISHLIAYGFKKSDTYKQMCLEPGLNAKDVMVKVNDWVREEMKKVEGVDYENVLTIPGAAATFALLDFEKDQLSLAHVADTIEVDDYDAYLQNDPNAAKVKTGNRNAVFDDATMELTKQVAQEKGITLVEAAKDPRVQQQLKDSYKSKINTPNGVGILNGMSELSENGLIEEIVMDLKPVAEKFKKEHQDLSKDYVGNLTDGVMKSDEQEIRVGLACDGYWTAFPDEDKADANRILYSMESLRGQEAVHEFFTNIDNKQEVVPRLKMVDDITSTFIRIRFNGSLDIEDNFKVVPLIEGEQYEYPEYISNLNPLPIGDISSIDGKRRLSKEMEEAYSLLGGATSIPV